MKISLIRSNPGAHFLIFFVPGIFLFPGSASRRMLDYNAALVPGDWTGFSLLILLWILV
jgi:hypothetical protein